MRQLAAQPEPFAAQPFVLTRTTSVRQILLFAQGSSVGIKIYPFAVPQGTSAATLHSPVLGLTALLTIPEVSGVRQVYAHKKSIMTRAVKQKVLVVQCRREVVNHTAIRLMLTIVNMASRSMHTELNAPVELALQMCAVCLRLENLYQRHDLRMCP